MKRKLWLLVVVIVLLVAGGGGYYYYSQHSQTKQSEAATQTPKSTIHLVALGDSLTYGVGDQAKNGGYVGLIQKKLEKHLNNTVKASNYGVSGDRSDQILARLNKQSQIQEDLKNADVIVMTVGGNDLLQTLEKQLFNNSQSKLDSAIDSAGETYQAKLKKLFSAVRKQNPDAPIFVFSIYDPVYTYFPKVTTITDSISKWNQITQETLADYGPSYFVDINHLLSYGQYKTAAQREKLAQQSASANSESISQSQVIKIMDGEGTNLNKYISTDDNFHPNHAGYKLMTNALYQMMLKHDSFMYEDN